MDRPVSASHPATAAASTDRRRDAACRVPSPDPLSPADRYAELFEAVQAGRVFADGKTFVDCVPRGDPDAILAAYRQDRTAPGFDLSAFVHRHFVVQQAHASHYVSPPGQSLADHIDGLWPVLTRHPRAHPPRCSLLQLPEPYVVPGGRFAELYYWDSYFTMLGLAASGQAPLLHAMTDNFAYLIDTFGFVPNGTRSYYLSRSQPPVFALMAELCAQHGGPPAAHYLPQMLREHAWWMDGADMLAPGQAHRRAVRLADGTVLNRYWDDRDTPREESWREDHATAAAQHGRPAHAVWRDLRAAAESGWDFSARWLCDPADPAHASRRLCDIRTTALLPADLNALLCRLEATIARLCREGGDTARAEAFERRAHERGAAVRRLLWDAAAGAFFDYDWERTRLRSVLTAATVVPLFAGVADAAQARAVAATLRQRLLAPGGLGTSENESGEQWDRPNGWAPLQWMAIQGLRDYGEDDLAGEIAHRWLTTVGAVYERESKLVEKYALRPGAGAQGGDGGEYPLQDGFGWTNGVVRRLLADLPAHPAAGCRAAAGAPAQAPG
ncbi:alpha,alpha-trehalase TreF [uncultured Xylophilus sp.]|uniref:alpha,alpha-trehalase TreF n=1 Tax=uncultured Xylophilus sp. TaxID=296832 RepID=UPI0025E7F104|nr:alpha,alpha-trehalase TreF [uncultured Xylophilus sp.]